MVRRAERLVWCVARFGAAVGGNWARDHLRRHGGHQHGPWRNGDDRGLYHLCGAGDHSHEFPRSVRLFVVDRRTIGLHRRRCDRHSDRADHHPLSLRPAVGNLAGDLGPVVGVAASGANCIRSHQSGSRQSILDERCVPTRTDIHHLQPALDPLLHAGGVRDPARHVALYGTRVGDARGDAEPSHGGFDGHRHLASRCADIRSRLWHCGHRGRGAVADRQRQSQSRSELHHRFLHGRGVRRRRQFVGHAGRRLHARHRQQIPRAGRGRRAWQDRYPGPDHPVHPEAAPRTVRAQGTGGGSMTPHLLTRSLDRSATVFLLVVAVLGILIPLSNLLLSAGSTLQVPTYLMSLFGKYVCYAILALSIDLIWGYCGILSLGHGAFFALGGYAMGMYLMRQIGTRGVYANPILPDFMVFLNYKALPIYWYGFQHFAYASLMVLLVPGALAFVFGWFAFRSRVTGVYLSIITQALTYALMLGFFRNNFGFGGNNGLTDFKDILGFNVQAETTRGALFSISCLALIVGLIVCRAVVTSKLGKVLIAIRDAESRTRFLGYRVESYKLFVFTLSACMAGVAGALYVPQVGIINPGEFAPGNSIEAVIWVAVGGRGTLTGAVVGAVLVTYAKTYFTSGFLAPYWLFMLGGLFIAVTLLLPRGIVGTIYHWTGLRRDRASAAAEDGVTEPLPAE